MIECILFEFGFGIFGIRTRCKRFDWRSGCYDNVTLTDSQSKRSQRLRIPKIPNPNSNQIHSYTNGIQLFIASYVC